MNTLLAGTRASMLAWTQSGQALALLEKLHPGVPMERVRIETRGDKDQKTPLVTLTGTGLFTKELEAALVAKTVDFAIHSLKDVPFALVPGARLFFLPREDPRDVLLSRRQNLSELPEGGLVGTGSPRRIAQLKHARPDLRFADLRGNLDTRLRKLEEGQYDAIVLAAAGLHRLGWQDKIQQYLDPAVCLPAFGQGILAIECMESNTEVCALLQAAEDPQTRVCALAERALMMALGGGCKVALAAMAQFDASGQVHLHVMVGDDQTGALVRDQWCGAPDALDAAVPELADRVRMLARQAGVPGFV